MHSKFCNYFSTGIFLKEVWPACSISAKVALGINCAQDRPQLGKKMGSFAPNINERVFAMFLIFRKSFAVLLPRLLVARKGISHGSEVLQLLIFDCL